MEDDNQRRCDYCVADIDARNSRCECNRCGKSCCLTCLLPPWEKPLELWCAKCLAVDDGTAAPDYLTAGQRDQLIDLEDRLARVEQWQQANFNQEKVAESNGRLRTRAD